MRTTAEAALLAAILNGANPADAVHVTGASFYDRRDGEAWTAMVELTGEGIRPDPSSIATRLGTAADIDYLRALVDKSVHPGSVAHHAKAVAEKASRRELATVAFKIHEAVESEEPYDRVIEKARAALDRAVLARQDSRTLAEIYPDMLRAIRDGGYRGLSTPWPDLDRHIVGLQPGRLYTVAARPGVGKSIFAQNIAEHMALVHKRRVYFSTLEMQDVELGIRLLSAAVGIDSKQLQTGHLSAAERQAVEDAGSSGFVDMAIDICATSTQTIESIRSGARDSTRRGRLGLVVVDYLQLMDGTQGKNQSRAEVVAGFTRGLKNMASELNVPVLALSQLNRGAAGGKATSANLRESGAIEQDSDVVILLHEDLDTNPGVITVEVDKARNGSKGRFELDKYGRFSSMRSPGSPSPLKPHGLTA